MESSFRKPTGGRTPGWSLSDLAESKGTRVMHLVSRAKAHPLPTPILSVQQNGKTVDLYVRKDLEEWYCIMDSECLVHMICPLCAAHTQAPPVEGLMCKQCGLAVMVRSFKRRLPPEHGTFSITCPCERCRMFYNGQGTVNVNLRFGERAFDMRIDTHKQLQFYNTYESLAPALTYIAREVFRTKEVLVPSLWAQRVRLLGMGIYVKRKKFLRGPVTPEHLEDLAKLIEELE